MPSASTRRQHYRLSCRAITREIKAAYSSRRSFSIGVQIARTGLIAQQLAELEFDKAGQREVEAQALQLTQFDPQQVLVPAGIQRQLVVRDDVRPPLGLGPASRHHDRYLGQTETLGRQHPAVARNDRSGFVHKHRRSPPPFADRGRDLGDLFIGMGPGVPGKWDQSGHRPALDGVGRPPGLSRGDRAGFCAGTAALRPLSGHCCPSAEGPQKGLFLEVLADGKNSLREPPSGSAPQKPQGSRSPRPPRRALRAL